MALFLSTWDSFPLKDAIESDQAGTPRKDGKEYLTTDADTLKRGKIAFADNCASCHSSKRPNPMPNDLRRKKQRGGNWFSGMTSLSTTTSLMTNAIRSAN